MGGNAFQIIPPQASTFAVRYDYLYWTLTAVVALSTLAVCVMTLWFAIRYRKGTKVNRQQGHSDFTEVSWAMIPLVVGLITFVWSTKLYGEAYRTPKDALEVFVVGKQWMWQIQHTNGLRENNMLHVPKGRPVKLTLISQDVIHSFFVPAFRLKRDVIPGRYNDAWFEATQVGEFHLFCAEYCGTDHSRMVGKVIVMEPADYQKWLTEGGQAPTTAVGAFKGTVVGDPIAAQGEQVYVQHGCQNCHAVGNIVRAPSHVGLFGKPVKLADGKTVTADENYIRESILDPNAKIVAGYPKPTIMPSYRLVLNEDQIRQLVAYMKYEGKGKATGASAAPTGRNTQ